jgi:hypothetical protein
MLRVRRLPAVGIRVHTQSWAAEGVQRREVRHRRLEMIGTCEEGRSGGGLNRIERYRHRESSLEPPIRRTIPAGH